MVEGIIIILGKVYGGVHQIRVKQGYARAVENLGSFYSEFSDPSRYAIGL